MIRASRATSERTLLRDQVYQRLFDAIVDGSLAPGEHLKDEDLITRFEVSRAPLREALQQLRDIGFVEMVPNRYTRVAPVDLGRVSKTINLMLVYYELAVTVAVPDLTETDLADLDAIFEELSIAIDVGDVGTFSDVLYEYFYRFATASGNDVLQRSMTRLTPHLERSMTPREGLISMSEIRGFVERVHRAAQRGDATAAAEAVRDMGEVSRRTFLEKVRPNDLLA
ncbi:DNA-binding GntR family transcriptional regulator [Microbacterium phyllosphaerae]|uniref:DNA-binding GntR family transcriptional regulator n=1 Tax=Microbacterium phyllosphaerae TaxID=124798 RepID=A0ABS4WL30_9MICO|nr:GntR family transcriptional regulator [Microbacterium phyllosphaerae]MBP2376911.1 DNA-binding GntR family transcriptional regulator [Microbacterium phyllosphaerae]